MKITNLIFYFVLFVGFFLPTNTTYYINFLGLKLQIRELAFISLPIINIFCSPSSATRKFVFADKKYKSVIVLFILFVLSTEVIKHLIYFEGLGNAFKGIRIGLPLISSLLLVYTGFRSDIIIVWRTLLVTIIISSILSLFSPYLTLPIYHSNDSSNFFDISLGRYANANSSFGIIGIYLLYSKNDVWYNKGKLPKIASFLSISTLLLTFNRTYLALLVFIVIYFSFSLFSIKKLFGLFIVPIWTFLIIWFSYFNSEDIKRQVDSRILDILTGDILLAESIYENNREVILDGVISRINEGYWVFGLTYDNPIFTWHRDKSMFRDFGVFDMPVTDTSWINVLLRYGFIPALILPFIFFFMYKASGSKIFIFSTLLFSLASFNIDSLLRHNSIFFLAIVFFLPNELSSIRTIKPKNWA